VRKPAAVLLGSLAAMLCFGAVASAGIIMPTKVSASVSPPHQIADPPYTFTTSGTITFRRRHCPPGTTNPAYCTTITDRDACHGKVSLTVKLGDDPLLADASTIIKTTTANVDGDCTYSIKITFPKSDFTANTRYAPHANGAYVHASFMVSFLGNTVLDPEDARTQTVVAKLLQP
jgi:hypothetical protein